MLGLGWITGKWNTVKEEAILTLIPALPKYTYYDLIRLEMQDRGIPFTVDNYAKAELTFREMASENMEFPLAATYQRMHIERMKRVNYAKEYGFEACHKKYPSYGNHVTMPNIVKSTWDVGKWSAIIMAANALYSIPGVLGDVVSLNIGGAAEYIEKILSYGTCYAGYGFLFAYFDYHGDERMNKLLAMIQTKLAPTPIFDPEAVGKYLISKHMRPEIWKRLDGMAKGLWDKIFVDDSGRIDIGVSSGVLRSLSVANDIEAGAPVWITKKDACTGLFATGGIGTGKTTRVYNPLVAQALGGCGTLHDDSIVAIAVKGNVREDMYALWMMSGGPNSGVDLRVVGSGENDMGYNPIDPRVVDIDGAATMIHAVVEMGGENKDPQWDEMFVNITKTLLKTMEVLGRYQCLGELEKAFKMPMKKIQDEIIPLVIKRGEDKAMDKEDADNLVMNLQYWVTMPEETRGSIVATAGRWLDGFSDRKMKKFNELSEFSLADLLATGKRLLLVPYFDKEKLGNRARTLANCFVQQVYTTALKRLGDKTLDQKKYMWMFMDECQEYLSAKALSNQALSREAKIIPVALTQSYSGFISAMGSKERADAIAANFRNRINFNSDDEATRDITRKLVGNDCIIPQHNYSLAVGKTLGYNFSLGQLGSGLGGLASGGAAAAGGLAGGLFGLFNFNVSKTWTRTNGVTMQRGPIPDTVLNNMGDGDVICKFNWSNHNIITSMELAPLYIDKDDDITEQMDRYLASLSEKKKAA